MIKKLLIVSMAILLMGGVAFAYTAGPGSAGDIAGQGKYDWQPHKTFRLVRYVPRYIDADCNTLSKDSIVIWNLTSDDGVSISPTVTSADSAVAGVAVTDFLTPDATRSVSNDYGKRNWGFIQTYGLCEAKINATNLINEGDAICTSATAGGIDGFRPSTTNMKAQGIAGFALNAGPVSGTTAVFLKCE